MVCRITSYNVCYTKLLRESFEEELANSQYIWKFVAEGDIEKINEFAQLDWIQEHFTGEQSWHNRIDFSRKGNTKGARLEAFLAQHNIKTDEVIAIGDNHNDISMIQLAGLGVAMANAEDAVKAIADRVTKESNRITSYNVCYTKLLRWECAVKD